MSDNSQHLPSAEGNSEVDYTIPDDPRSPFDECSEAYQKLGAERDRLLTLFQRLTGLFPYDLEPEKHQAALDEVYAITAEALGGEAIATVKAAAEERDRYRRALGEIQTIASNALNNPRVNLFIVVIDLNETAGAALRGEGAADDGR